MTYVEIAVAIVRSLLETVHDLWRTVVGSHVKRMRIRIAEQIEPVPKRSVT
jgi:hypothetical protein